MPDEGATFTVILPIDQPEEVLLSHAPPDDVPSVSEETYVAV
jgi:hypothetical protein